MWTKLLCNLFTNLISGQAVFANWYGTSSLTTIKTFYILGQANAIKASQYEKQRVYVKLAGFSGVAMQGSHQ